MVEHNNTVSIKFRSIWRISLLTIRTCMFDEKTRVLWSAHARHVLGHSCTLYEEGNRRAREELRSGQKRCDTERGQCYTAVAQGHSVHTQWRVAGLIEKKNHNNLMKQIILLFHVWIHLPHCFLFAIIKTWKRRKKNRVLLCWL